MQSNIENKLRGKLQPQHLTIENESHMHGGPATESHFKLTVVAAEFEGQRPVQRHRQVYALLAEEMAQGVHALALHLFSPREWELRDGQVADSPDCRGGSAAEA